MFIKQIRTLVPFYLLADVPLYVWGAGAIGKSKVIQQIATELGYHLVDLRLATQEAVDLIGFPTRKTIMEKYVVSVDEKGNRVLGTRETQVTSWAKPEWLHEIQQKDLEGIPTILFMDEMDRAQRDVIQCAYQINTDRKLHTHELPASCRIIAAGNPPTPDNDVSTHDEPMLTRWAHLYVEPDVNSFLEGFGARLDPNISGYIAAKASPEVIRSKYTNWDVTTAIKVSPRTWELADRLYKATSHILTGDRRVELQVLLGSAIGPQWAMDFITSLNTTWIRATDVINGQKSWADVATDPVNVLRIFSEIQLYMRKDWFETEDRVTKVSKKDKQKLERFVKFYDDAIDGNRKELVVAALSSLGQNKTEEGRKLLGDLSAVITATKSKCQAIVDRGHSKRSTF